MLQMMVKKVEEEGKKETELFEKFMCYCNTGKATLGKAIADAEEKIPQLESDIKAAKGLKAQLDGDLEKHKTDRADAKEAMGKTTAVREKEAAAFAKENGEDESNLAALTKALAAIEKGMAGAFLQTNSAAVLKQLSLAQDMSNADRDLLASFLMGESSHGYSPASGEIVGILKQMKDTMEKDLAEVVAEEDKAKQDFDAAMGAKGKQIAEATKAIEEKVKRSGEVAVEIVNLEEDLEDTQESLAEDTKFLADLEKNCAAKEKEWAEICKMRQEELIALADTIKILNDDDAQELFKKTVPSAASFLQIQVTQKEVRAQATKILASVHRTGDLDMEFITMALKGKKVSFDKVIKMIEDMVALLGKEQVEDDNKKVYCENEFDKADDKKKELEISISDMEKAIDETKDSMKTISEEVQALEDGIIKLDREVAAATEQRKDEHADFEEMRAANNAAVGLIEMAKNRMQKFYNPKLYKPPPKRELSEEERISLNMGGTLAPTNPPALLQTGISLLQVRSKDLDEQPAPPPAPSKPKKKGEEAGGVLAMMDMMKADVEKETQESEFAEKDAQGEYETMVKDAAAKRAADTKTIEKKMSQKAELEATLVKTEDAKKVETAELMATKEYIGELHADCDWLIENFDVRKEARANEIDALKKAVAVLSGADYSLVQLGRKVVVKHA
jgi:septal ring factor EnvC (AmiA/AmiB activator)